MATTTTTTTKNRFHCYRMQDILQDSWKTDQLTFSPFLQCMVKHEEDKKSFKGNSKGFSRVPGIIINALSLLPEVCLSSFPVGEHYGLWSHMKYKIFPHSFSWKKLIFKNGKKKASQKLSIEDIAQGLNNGPYGSAGILGFKLILIISFKP